jgi:O-antigen/teichoic acid export membrane protein
MTLEEPTELTTAVARPRRHLAFGTALAAGAQIAPLAASAGISLVIARAYGPSATGVISLVMNFVGVVALIGGVGLAAGITYLVSRGEWPLRQALNSMLRAAVGLGTAGAVLAICFYLLTRHSVLKGVTPVVAIISLASLPFALWSSFSASALLGRDRYESYTLLLVTQPLVFLCAGIGLGLAFGVKGAVTGFTGANLAAAAVGLSAMRRAAQSEPERAPTKPDRGPLRHAVRFGLQAWTANLLQLLNYRLDLFILSAVVTRADVGIYSVAVSLTALGWLLPDALQTVLFPRVASLDGAAAAGEIEASESDASAARAVRHSVLFVVPTAMALAVLVALVPLIYGPGFHRSVELGFILIPGVAALGPGKIVAAILTGRGFPRYVVYGTLITVPTTLALYSILIPTLHAVGAASASTISYSFGTALSFVLLRLVTNISLRSALFPTRADLMDYVDAFRLARARVGARFDGSVSH